jgi:hypothetical protein
MQGLFFRRSGDVAVRHNNLSVVRAMTRAQHTGYGHAPVPEPGPVPVPVTGIETVLFGLLVSVTVTVAGPVNEAVGGTVVRPMVNVGLAGVVAVTLESLDAVA